jgi:hypothetical protein
MDEEVILILKQIGLNINSPSDLNGLLIPREQLLSDNKYKDDEIDGYMAAINKLLSLHDDEFRKLINFSNEG